MVICGRPTAPAAPAARGCSIPPATGAIANATGDAQLLRRSAAPDLRRVSCGVAAAGRLLAASAGVSALLSAQPRQRLGGNWPAKRSSLSASCWRRCAGPAPSDRPEALQHTEQFQHEVTGHGDDPRQNVQRKICSKMVWRGTWIFFQLRPCAPFAALRLFQIIWSSMPSLIWRA